MKKIIPTIGFVVLLLGKAVSADVVELPLYCAGMYDINTPAWTTNFDFGVTFSEITNVHVHWSGTITAELRYYGDPDHPYPVDALFNMELYELNLTTYLGSAYIIGGADTYPVPEPFDLETVCGFSHSDLEEPLISLLDGQASVSIRFCQSGSFEDITLVNPIGQLDSATLIFEGTIIPEPATIFLFAFTGLLIRKNKHHTYLS